MKIVITWGGKVTEPLVLINTNDSFDFHWVRENKKKNETTHEMYCHQEPNAMLPNKKIEIPNSQTVFSTNHLSTKTYPE